MKNTTQVKEKIMSKKTSRKIIISSIMFFSMTFSFFPQQARADVWGAAFGAMMVDQMITTIKRQIEGALMGTLKMAAVQMLNSKVGQLIGGGVGGQPLFITDFNEFLYQSPREKANLYMNDFFSMTTRGKASSANYIAAGSNSGGLRGDYTGYLVSSAKRVTTERSIPTYSLDEHGGMDAFSRGNSRAFNAFFRNPMNNPYGYSLEAQQMYREQIEAEQTVAATKALATGFLPKEQGGRVLSPAATIQAATTNIQNLGNDILAAAQNPGELLSGVVMSMANKLVSNLIQKGVGEIQSKITKEIRNVDKQIYGSIQQATREVGPAVKYIGNVDKNLRVIIKNNTTPPPAALPPDP
ncbi:MAG: hypothetical protein PHH40_03740 [Candidatus Moranbacteria bacterium]|nr:hypothetical protein [Candidatus Moranbacteria bacterium]MDD3964641.1 hypothetical protein [Candidatus Moranbacteria bacterium]